MSIVKNGSRDLIKGKESTSIYRSASFKSEEKSIIKDTEYNTEINKSFVKRTAGEQSLNKIINNEAIYKGNNKSSNKNYNNNGYRNTINRKELNRDRVNIQSYKSYQYTKATIRKEERLGDNYSSKVYIKNNNQRNVYPKSKDNRIIVNKGEVNRQYNKENLKSYYKSSNSNIGTTRSGIKYNKNNNESKNYSRSNVSRTESRIKYTEGNIINSYESTNCNIINNNELRRNNVIRSNSELSQSNIIKDNGIKSIIKPEKNTLINNRRIESIIKSKKVDIKNNNAARNYTISDISKTGFKIKYNERNIRKNNELSKNTIIINSKIDAVIKSKENNIIKDNRVKSIIKPEKITLINNRRVKYLIKRKEVNIKNNNLGIIKRKEALVKWKDGIDRNSNLDGIIKVKEPIISAKIINNDISKKFIKNRVPNIKNYDIYGNKKRKLNIVKSDKLNPIGRYKKVIEDLKYVKSINFSKIKKEFFKGRYIRSILNNGIDNLNISGGDYSNTIAKEKIYRIAAAPRDVVRAGRSLKRAYNGARYIKDISKNIKSISNLKTIKLKRVVGKGITTSLINEVNSLKGNENIGIQSIVKTKDAIVNTKNTIHITKNTLRYSVKATKKATKLTKNTFEYSRKGVKRLKKATKLTYNIGRKLSVMTTKFLSNPMLLKTMIALAGIIISLSLVISIVTGVISIFVGEQSNVENAVPNESQREFILKLVPIAQKNYKEFGIFPSVTIAQAIHESGWGKSQLSIQANNLFGVKADSSWTGNTIEMLTQEYINGEIITVMAKWRAYENFEDSVRDHGKFLKENSRYEKAGVFKAKDYKEQAYAIRMAGYATDPQYASLICNTIEAYSLNIYDFTIGDGNEVIEIAISTGMSIVGKSPYVFGGGRNPEDIAALRFDCSSFVHWCYANAGLNLGDYRSVTTFSLIEMGRAVSINEIKRGDLIFFDTYATNGHIGIWLGDNKFLHDGTSKGATVSEFTGYYKEKFNGKIRRIIE